jgi:hypothetical protein
MSIHITCQNAAKNLDTLSEVKKNNNFDAESIFEISRPHHALLN